MRRAFAGLWDARRPPTADDEHVMTRALGGGSSYRRATRWRWLGSAPAAPAGDPLCLIDGVIFDGPSTPSELAAGLARDDARFLASLRGDFALVFYDHVRGTGVLARDQLGGRALVWHERNGRLVFASEVRYLLPLLGEAPEPDPVAIAHLLAMSGQPVERAFYTGVHRLPVAHLMRFGQRPERYWAPRYSPPVARRREEHVEGLRAELTQAVRRRSRPGETVAVQLSGGLDSSTMAGVGSRLEPERRVGHAYSAVFPDHPSVDESGLIADLCSTLDLASTRVVVRSGSVISGLIDYLEAWGVPTPSPNLFFWLPLMERVAADGVGVLLDGEGGDEVLGLSPTLIADRVLRGRVLGAIDLVRRVPGGGPHLTRGQIWAFLREWGVKAALPMRVHRLVQRRRPAEAFTFRWVRPEVARTFFDTDPGVEWKQLRGPRWWAHYVGVVLGGRGMAQATDHVRRRAAMHGIEMRHPILDVDLAEFVMTIPPEEHFDPRFNRPLVREAMAGVLPDSVRLRSEKSFFDAVFHESLAGPDLPAARRLLLDPNARIGAYVDVTAVERDLLASPPPAGKRLIWAGELWRAVTTECWLRVLDGGADALRDTLDGLLAPADLRVVAG